MAQCEVPMRKRTRKRAGKSRSIVQRLKPEQTPAEANAEIAVEGVGHNIATAAEFSKCFYLEPDLTKLTVAQIHANEAIQNGDLKAAEALLNARAVTLNAIFAG
jgi:hypothetical protein